MVMQYTVQRTVQFIHDMLQTMPPHASARCPYVSNATGSQLNRLIGV